MIYVECKPDFALVKSITSVPKREILHERGKDEVCNRLEKRRNCKGMVDEHPSSIQHAYLRKMRLKEDLFQHGLKVRYDESSHNHLVVLCPWLEPWIVKAAEEAGIEMEKYGLPDNPASLHREINIDLSKFERLLADLKSKNTERLRTLRRLLEG